MPGRVDDELHLDPARDAGTRQHGGITRLRLRDHLYRIVQLRLEEDLARDRAGSAFDAGADTTFYTFTREVARIERLLVQVDGRNVFRNVGWRHDGLKSLRRRIRGDHDVRWR